MLFCFKGKHVHKICCHHIDMFDTHFVHSCHEGCCIKKGMSYALWMVYVVKLSVYVWLQSSPINVYTCFNYITLSHFPEKPNLIQLLITMCFPSATIKLVPFPTQTLQPTKILANTILQKCTEQSGNQHCSPEMHREVWLHYTQKLWKSVLPGPPSCSSLICLKTMQCCLSYPICLTWKTL